MKRNYLDRILLLLFIVTLSFSCNEPAKRESGHREEAFDEEVRKMVHPVNKTVFASVPIIYSDSMTRSIDLELEGRITYDERNKTAISSKVAGRIEKLVIKYNYQPVNKGQL